MELAVSTWLPLAAQTGLALSALGALAWVPPAQGKMLLISLGGEDTPRLARWASSANARLIGPGPLAHSLLVDGNRSELSAQAWQHRAVILAGNGVGCGTEAAR